MNKLREMLAKFMYGRYGTDRLNMFLLIVLIVCAGLNLFVRNGYFSIVMSSWETLLVVLIYYRMCSRNIQKRYAENQKYLGLENKVKRFFGRTKYIQEQRKDFHIYTCPQCRQKIRIPKGKGKISIRCPKCGAEFVKKS
ncbi:MAG TPA: zinc-ribbon domain-containing protein [Candidatus Blautia stercoravium]|nr:zinc-ribbon domain-containing protein [Candidatus Blautia stercoravium]